MSIRIVLTAAVILLGGCRARHSAGAPTTPTSNASSSVAVTIESTPTTTTTRTPSQTFRDAPLGISFEHPTTWREYRYRFVTEDEALSAAVAAVPWLASVLDGY
jgi:hypothetical protein